MLGPPKGRSSRPYVPTYSLGTLVHLGHDCIFIPGYHRTTQRRFRTTIWLARRNGLALAFLFLVLLMAIASSQTRRASALGVINDVFNPGFEDTNSNFWFVTATYGGGTVNINDVSNSHSGSYSAMLNGVNTTLQCSGPECKDTVRATVEQYVQFNQPPTLSNLAETNNSFSAWWFVADP